jgi:O-antigen/teichoic acid export membrane protein
MRASSFLKNAAVYGFGNLLVQVAGFVLVPLYTRSLARADYGTLEVLNRTSEVLVLCLMVNGLSQGAFTFYKQAVTDEERRRAVASSFALVWLLGVIGGGMVMLAAGPLSAWLRVGSPGLLRLAIFALLMEASTVVPMTMTQARVESVLFSAFTLGRLVLKVVLCVLFLSVFHWGVAGILLGSAVSSGLCGAVLSVRELGRSGFRVDPAVLRQMVWFTLPFLPGGLCYFMLNSGDQYVLLRHAGREEVALYALGYKLAMAVGMFSRTPLMMVWTAQMYEVARRDDAPEVFGRVVTRISAVYLLAGLGLCVLAPELVLALAGPQYAGAAAVVPPVVLAYGFLSAAELMDAGFYVRRRTGVKIWITGATTLVTTGLYFLWIPRYTILGGAYATLAGFAFHTALTWAVSKRVFQVRYEWGRLAALIAVAVAVDLGVRLLPVSLWWVPVKLMAWALYPLALWLTGLVSSEEQGWVRESVGQGLCRARALFSQGHLGEVR